MNHSRPIVRLFSGKWWGPRTKQPILALHGWQDNAGTFDTLAPLLPRHIPLLCIDLPGHGASSHYPPGMSYFIFWDGITVIRRIVKFFQWEKVTLLGHSLGGALSFMYASCFPAEVEKLIMIDIAGPTIRDQGKIAASVGPSIDKMLQYESLSLSKMPCYEYEEMINLVVDAYEGSVTRDSVKILMKRGMASAPVELHKNGFHFVRDLRLKVASMGMFSVDQVLAYAQQIKCEVLNIRGEPGKEFSDTDVYSKVIEAMAKSAKRVVYEKIPGTHHLHLNTPERVRGVITDFLVPTIL